MVSTIASFHVGTFSKSARNVKTSSTGLLIVTVFSNDAMAGPRLSSSAGLRRIVRRQDDEVRTDVCQVGHPGSLPVTSDVIPKSGSAGRQRTDLVLQP